MGRLETAMKGGGVKKENAALTSINKVYIFQKEKDLHMSLDEEAKYGTFSNSPCISALQVSQHVLEEHD